MQVPGPRVPPALYRTTDMSIYGVEFSPFQDGLLAIASSQYFGIVGNGKQYIVRHDALTNEIIPIRVYETQDALFDCCWSESNEHQIFCASGDGSVKLFDLGTKDGFPIQNYREHGQECASVDYNLVRKDVFITASWDRTCKLWDPHSPRSVATFTEHQGPVYNAQWSPRNPNVFASCSGDGSFKIWDSTLPRSASTIRAHQGEVLAIDWSKYNEFLIVTGSTDRTLKTWDLRRPGNPMHTLGGHEYAIRRLKTSPHDERIVMSVSYDMTACLWDIYAEDSLLAKFDHHTEFVIGFDFNNFRPGQIATGAWDEFLCVFDMNARPRPPRIPSLPKKKPLPMMTK